MASPNRAPFRADHVGSFLRPKELLDAREKFRTGAITREVLTEVEDRLIRDVVKKQEATGIQAITDGDFRRQSWSGDFIKSINGVRMAEAGLRPSQQAAPAGTVVPDWVPPSPETFSKMSLPAGGIQTKSFNFLKGLVTKTAKVTVPSPSMLHFRGGRGGVDKAAYPDMDQFFEDLIAVYKGEVKALADAGCRYLQFDDTNLAYLCDPKLRARVQSLGEDPDKLPALYARLINGAIADRPADMRITVHLCRGNSLSRGHAEGGYEPVADQMFNLLKVDGFFLEYDDARSGDFAPLRFVPKGNLRVVVGVITSKFAALEPKDQIKKRIEEAAKYMPLDQMCLSAQCGFASHTGGNIITEDEQWAKLRHVVEIAREVWPGEL
jgi:5-methyltetrahydropteroyltriglutamate--homocysteine methyltransferase